MTDFNGTQLELGDTVQRNSIIAKITNVDFENESYPIELNAGSYTINVNLATLQGFTLIKRAEK